MLVRSAILTAGRAPEGRLAKLLTVAHKGGKSRDVPKVVRGIAGAMVVVVPALYVLTARVFSTLRARPDWNTTGLAAVFVASALLSGLAAVGLVSGLRRRERAETGSAESPMRLIGNGLMVVIVVDIFLTLSPLVSTRQFNSPSRYYIWASLEGAAILEFAFGLILPLVILMATRARPRLVLPSVLILSGAFVKRWHIIIPAMRRRNLPLPEGSYHPNLTEFAVSAGLVALGILVLYALIRIVAAAGAMSKGSQAAGVS